MPVKLDNDPDQDNRGVYDDGNPGWYKPEGAAEASDPLDDLSNADSATDKNLPANHPSRSELAKRENSPDHGADPVSPQEAGAVNKLFNDTEDSRPKLAILKIFTRKRAAISAASLITGGGIIGMLTFSTGSGQLAALGRILDRPAQAHSNSIKVRLQSLTRNGRAQLSGDVGDTRVSKFGAKRFRALEAQWKEAGIEYRRREATGRPTSLSIEAAKNPEFRGKSLTETKNAIAKFYGIDASKIQQTSGLNGGKFAINMTEMKTGAARNMAFSSVRTLEDGKLLSAMNKRVIGKFFNLPSIFQPSQRSLAEKEDKLYTKAERKARELERSKNRKPTLRSKYVNAKAKVKEKIGPHARAINATLFVAGGICLVKSIADAIPETNYANIVVPGMIEVADKQALGSQIEANQVDDPDLHGDVIANFTGEDGTTIWQGKALNALTYNNGGVGIDIDPGYRQAFSILTTSDAILSALDTPDIVGDLLCSPVGLVVQGTASATLLALGPGGWTAKASQFTASVAATSALFSFFETKAIDHFVEDPITTLAGGQGGNILAEAARASAGMPARPMGGVELSAPQAQSRLDEVYQQERQEFQQKSMFARIFDSQDQHSLVAGLARESSPDPIRNIATITAKVFNPGNWAKGLFAVLSPKIGAQEEPYEWATALYGIPDELLNNPKYDDYQENADKAAKILEGGSGDSYKQRARDCFGVDIRKGQFGWETIAVEDVNPTDKSYVDANCNDLGDENWNRIIMFTFDDSIFALIECYEEGGQICQETGFGGLGGSGGSVALGGRSIGADTSGQSCTIGTDKGTGITPDPAKQIRLCEVGGITVNVAVEANVDAIIKGAQAAGLRITGSGYRSYARQIELRMKNCGTSQFAIYQMSADSCSPPTAPPGRSLHEWGLAVDLNCNGVLIGSKSNACFQWLQNNQGIHNLKNLPSEPWHWSQTGN